MVVAGQGSGREGHRVSVLQGASVLGVARWPQTPPPYCTLDMCGRGGASTHPTPKRGSRLCGFSHPPHTQKWQLHDVTDTLTCSIAVITAQCTCP